MFTPVPTPPTAATAPTAAPIVGGATSNSNATAAATAVGIDAAQIESVRTEVAQPNVTDLTSPADGYVYDFSVLDEDYIGPLAPLPYVNLTRVRDLAPAVPQLAAAVQLPVADGLVSWSKAVLVVNKALWNGGAFANRKVEDAVVTLREMADLYMDTPLFEVTNKTSLLPAQPPHMGENPRMYFSLSEYYWPDQVSSVNPNGIPYAYSPSVNTEVRSHLQQPRCVERSSVCSSAVCVLCDACWHACKCANSCNTVICRKCSVHCTSVVTGCAACLRRPRTSHVVVHKRRRKERRPK